MIPPLSDSLDALFVGYENQENLGLRSIVATLRASGYQAQLLPFVPGEHQHILQAIRAHAPKLVGFSIIFQYTVDEFAQLATSLRDAGVTAHFTIGGHYPSLRPQEALRAMPAVDSVVRFEGELTALELLEKVHQPASWDSILGLAFRRGEDIVVNPPRPLIAALDTLPPPVRDKPRLLPRGIRAASIIASRGCLFNCAFCSIRQFYGGAPGPLRRTRSPQAVVAEMQALFSNDGVRFFIFQDDDFAARSPQQRRWVQDFLKALDEQHLTGEVRWKIACRVDDVEAGLLSQCREHGLIAVYLGVESGSRQGLRTLNKRVSVDQNRRAIETLKQLGLAFDMGFMLFDPDSTLDTIRENINFLMAMTADGCCPANFCKMLPYAGTPVEQRLRQEGRLKGSVGQPDYDFKDPRLDWFALFASQAFRHRNFDRLGLVERLRLSLFDKTLARAFEPAPWVDEYERALQRVTASANLALLDVLEAGLDFVRSKQNEEQVILGWPWLGEMAQQSWCRERSIQQDLDAVLRRYSPELLMAFMDELNRTVTA
ncbi:MAG: B12-binding domain-containing radical SAM protein [Chloroflexi bacterium]|nr:B12-binding domain-containing radical SAM protein [Chloroflexota bacterium]